MGKLRPAGPFGNFSRPPSFNGQHIFIGLPSLYVIRSLNKYISTQFKFLINDSRTNILALSKFGHNNAAPSEKSLPTPAINSAYILDYIPLLIINN